MGFKSQSQLGSSAMGGAPQLGPQEDPEYQAWLSQQGGPSQFQLQRPMPQGQPMQQAQFLQQPVQGQGYMQNYSELAGALRGNKPY